MVDRMKQEKLEKIYNFLNTPISRWGLLFIILCIFLPLLVGSVVLENMYPFTGFVFMWIYIIGWVIFAKYINWKYKKIGI